MRLGWLGASVCVFAAFTAGSMKVAIDAAAGEGTTKAAFNYGIGSSSEMLGEVAKVPAQVVQDVKPGLQNLQGQMGGILGGGTPAPATPTADPSDATDGAKP